MSHVTIVPPAPSDSGLTQTNGTKVLLDDGSELKGVFRIVLRADVSDIWRAEIHCYPKMDAMTAWPTIQARRERWWQRLMRRLSGTPLEVTDLQDTARRFDDQA